MKIRTRSFLAFLIISSLLALPVSALGKKGKDHFDRGMKYEQAQQWEQAAREFTLALAADASNVDYRLHYQRAMFNASQMFMQRGTSLSEQRDYVGAYNAFRQAFGYDPVNQLAVSEMERMLRLQEVKEGRKPSNPAGGDASSKTEPSEESTQSQGTGTTKPAQEVQTRNEPTRLINYNGPLQHFIRTMATELGLNVIFDKQSFATPRNIEINLTQPITTAKALDFVFLQEGLFFQKLDRNTILVADQARRPQYQQLVVRTFYLSNAKPQKAKDIITQSLPASVGRPQSIVVIDEDTNSLTVRDTAENVELIGELIRSIDKDRAEVVMDVNIYEVSRSDLLQLGNQLGSGTFNLGGSPGLSVLTSNAVTTAAQTGVNVASILSGVPTGAAAALVIPPSVLTAFQSRNNAKLLASTQVHAFNNEESTARIGQRVPVQTAQAYPFGVQTGTPTTTTTGGVASFPTGGFPVINYEPTGLTLSFTPIVFPNLDVQVKMKINSKDVAGASTLTPTFTEREIAGTARVQNNRTMLLASVSQDVESTGRQGLPVLGGLPLLGRLFTSPTRDNRQVDIVISVTPRVLRAPELTPRDEMMRPSGTLQAPTTGSIAQMLIENQRDEQIAAARRIPKEVNIQLPDAAVTYEPAKQAADTQPKTEAGSANTNVAQATPSIPEKTPALQPTQVVATNETTKAASETKGQTANTSAALTPEPPAPKNIVLTQAQAPPTQTMDVASAIKSVVSQPTEVKTTADSARTEAKVTPAVEELSPKSEPITNTVKASEPAANFVQLSITPDKNQLLIGEKKQVSVQVSTESQMRMALLSLHFDPHVFKVNSVSPGSLFANEKTAPSITQSIDNGVVLVTVTPAADSSISGAGSLLNIELEATGAGEGTLSFDPAQLDVIGKDGRSATVQIEQGRLTVIPADNPVPAPKPIPEDTSKSTASASPDPQKSPAIAEATIVKGALGSASAMATNDATMKAPASTPKDEAATKIAAPAIKPRTYVVQRNDNLWKIAAANRVSVTALQAANPNLRGDVLIVGTHLVIP